MCAHAVRVAVEKLPGVTGAEVSLETGVVAVRLTADSPLTIASVREAIRDQGFSPREADVWVAGRLEQTIDGLVLSVPGTGEEYSVRAAGEILEKLRAADGEVLVEGRVAEDEGDVGRLVLEVSAVVTR